LFVKSESQLKETLLKWYFGLKNKNKNIFFSKELDVSLLQATTVFIFYQKNVTPFRRIRTFILLKHWLYFLVVVKTGQEIGRVVQWWKYFCLIPKL